MIAHDHLLSRWFEAHGAFAYVLDVVLVMAICGGGWLANRRRGGRTPSA
jgi:hypothetical protein